VTVFAHELTFGYHRGWRVVESYNGTPITSLHQLRELWHATRDEVLAARQKLKEEGEKEVDKSNRKNLGIFVRLGLQNDDEIVLDAEMAMETEPEVIKTHAIERASFIKGDVKN